MALLSGPHVLAIHFVVAPGIAEVGGDHVRSRMNMADHALARRNGTRELMTNGMAGFVARNGGIGGRGVAPLGGVRGRWGRGPPKSAWEDECGWRGSRADGISRV